MILDLQLKALLDAHNDPTVDAIEIDAIQGHDEDGNAVSNYDDATNMGPIDGDADIVICWSVYVHRTGQGVECIADLPTEREAERFAEDLSKALKLGATNPIMVPCPVCHAAAAFGCDVQHLNIAPKLFSKTRYGYFHTARIAHPHL